MLRNITRKPIGVMIMTIDQVDGKIIKSKFSNKIFD